MMKVNLAGLAEQAARVIDPKKDRGAYRFMLEELAEHIRAVRAGEHTLAEFAEYYGLSPQSPERGA